jgi:hypothetical protein
MPFLLSVLVHPRPHNVGRADWPTAPSPPSSTSLKQISQILLTTIGITHENLPEKITLTFATTERQAFNDNVRQARTNVQQRWMDNDLDHVANEGRRQKTANVTQRHAMHGWWEATGNKLHNVDRSILAAINTMCYVNGLQMNVMWW